MSALFKFQLIYIFQNTKINLINIHQCRCGIAILLFASLTTNTHIDRKNEENLFTMLTLSLCSLFNSKYHSLSLPFSSSHSQSNQTTLLWSYALLTISNTCWNFQSQWHNTATLPRFIYYSHKDMKTHAPVSLPSVPCDVCVFVIEWACF